MFTPREYQNAAVDATLLALDEEGACPLVAMPTGAGKSGVLGLLCLRILTRYPNVRITIATHVKELIEQDEKALKKVWPDAPYGIFSAGLGVKEAHMPITLCSIQSAVRDLHAFGRQNLLLIDEAHMLSPDEESNYQKFIRHQRELNKHFRVIGLTATSYRAKGGTLVGAGIFTTIAFDNTDLVSFQDLIKQGYLIRLSARPTNFRYDVSGVKISAGDFNGKQLQEAVDVEALTRAALSEAFVRGRDRIGWMIFCFRIDHVKHVVEILKDYGEDALYVHSKMPDYERDWNIEQFKKRKRRIIVSDGILTTGFDAPHVDHIVLLRPTRSIVRHVQTLGRGTRPVYEEGFDLTTQEGRLASIEASGKHECLVSDFAGNLERLGPINDPKIPGRGKPGSAEAPIKICESKRLVAGSGCGTYNPAGAHYCEFCGAEFKIEGKKIAPEASDADAVRMDEPVKEWYKVDRIEYDAFMRSNHIPTLRVWYSCGRKRFSELVSFEHEHPWARHKARDWWRARTATGGALPMTHAEAVQQLDSLFVPQYVYVHVNLKYPKIVDIAFRGEEAKMMGAGNGQTS